MVFLQQPEQVLLMLTLKIQSIGNEDEVILIELLVLLKQDQ